MQDLLGKISQTILIIGTFSFLAAAVSLVIADVADGFTEKLVDIFFIIFGALFLLSLAALPRRRNCLYLVLICNNEMHLTYLEGSV